MSVQDAQQNKVRRDLSHTRRQRTFRLEAVVLRHSDWGEADRLLWLFSREVGKLRAIAKGARKPRSRKAGHLEPFTRVSLLLASGRDLAIVTQAETLDAYLPLRDDLLRTTFAAYVVELLDRFTVEQDGLRSIPADEGEHHRLYRILVDTLARLCQPFDLDLVVRYFEIRLLDHVGFRPQLFTCVMCNAEIQAQDQYFSAQRGGVLCPTCGTMKQGKPYQDKPRSTGAPHPIQMESGVHPISMQALKFLRHFQRSSFSEAMRARPTPEVGRELEMVMQHYLTYLLERGLNTPPFLRRIRKEAMRVVSSEQAPAEFFNDEDEEL